MRWSAAGHPEMTLCSNSEVLSCVTRELLLAEETAGTSSLRTASLPDGVTEQDASRAGVDEIQ